MGIPWRRALWPLVAALMMAVVITAPALAAPVVVPIGGGTITISDDRVAAGGTVTLTGAGITSTTGTDGLAAIAVKPDAAALPSTWSYGGADAAPGAAAGAPEPVAAFAVRLDGTFSGTLTVGSDTDLSTVRLYFLGGSLSTGSGANARKLVPGVGTGDISVAMTTGFTNTATPPVYHRGSVLPATGGALTAKGTGFDPSTAVTATVDGSPAVVASGGTTSPSGDLDAVVTIPAGLAAGAHVLAVTAGGTLSTTITTVPHTAELLTPRVRPGGLVAVRTAGYVGVSGAGQGVAINLAGTVINYTDGDPASVCPRADATGAGVFTATIPEGTAPGTPALNVLAGRDCVGTAPPIVTDPFGRNFSLAGQLTIAADAPQITLARTSVPAGVAIAFTAGGFAPGETVTVLFDGQPLAATLTADASGNVAGGVPTADDTAQGQHDIVLTSATAGVAAQATVVAPVAASATITSTLHVPNGTLAVSLRGFLRADGLGGQKVAFKIDRADPVLACVETDADGNADATIPLPATLASGQRELNVLAGSACGDGAQAPGRSIALAFSVPTVIADPPGPPAATAKTAPAVRALTLVNKGTRVRLTLRGGTAARTTVTLKTAARVRLTRKAKPAVLTLGKVVVRQNAKTATVKLTPRAKRFIAARPKGFRLRVKVVSAPQGGKKVTRTLVLRVTR